MNNIGLLQAQLRTPNNILWWDAQLIGLTIMYIAIFTIPRPHAVTPIGQGICSKSQVQFVCTCINKAPVSSSFCTPKVEQK
jgi:hypothetical protein